ncbi:HNH endonuclease [Candidatus Odyssella thessalonicensis]|uniref:HNH endonuclease n=1 Tax=Candidatus Odyssella thessalonicensis TaxID=84647 RepID=UPI00094B5B91
MAVCQHRALRNDINVGKIDASIFTLEQLSAINGGKAKIPELTWHHDQQARRMQLVNTRTHNNTHHTGSISLLEMVKKNES